MKKPNRILMSKQMILKLFVTLKRTRQMIILNNFTKTMVHWSKLMTSYSQNSSKRTQRTSSWRKSIQIITCTWRCKLIACRLKWMRWKVSFPRRTNELSRWSYLWEEPVSHNVSLVLVLYFLASIASLKPFIIFILLFIFINYLQFKR